MLKKTIFISLLVAFFLSGFVALGVSADDSAVASKTGASGLIPYGNTNNVTDRCTICHLIVGIKGLIDWGMEILVIVAVAGIFIAGIMYIISAGSGMMETAKNFLKSVLIGTVIMLGAWFIVNVILTWILPTAPGFGIQKDKWYSFNVSCPVPTPVMVNTGGSATEEEKKKEDPYANLECSNANPSKPCTDPLKKLCVSNKCVGCYAEGFNIQYVNASPTQCCSGKANNGVCAAGEANNNACPSMRDEECKLKGINGYCANGTCVECKKSGEKCGGNSFDNTCCSGSCSLDWNWFDSQFKCR